MTRLAPITAKAQLPAAQQPIFDAIVQSRGRIAGPFGVLLHSPELAGRVAHLGAYVRFDSALPPAVRELAILTTARELDCQYEWTAHVPLARQAGVRPEAIDAIGQRTAPAGLTEEEALVVRFGQQLLRQHRVEEATFRAALARFGPQGTVDLTATVGYYGLVACVLNAFEVPLEPGVAPLLPA
ncbi:MAG: carboxymuconolactone decarboxylase [Candidatus Tectimicrobiota bacterium]|nr:MAG: carboxymuconolactone decarboxylase [Candidatus Tectomicrobia bacterium]